MNYAAGYRLPMLYKGVKTLDKRKSIRTPSPEQLAAILNGGEPPLQNGLADAVGFGSAGFPQNQGSPWSEQVSKPTTIFKNLRWYLVSNFRQMLSEAYVELGLVQTIVDVPVDDGLRGGVELKSKQLDETQIAELTTSLDRDDDINTAAQAGKWNRLFGGAGLLILTDQDPEEPLNLDLITADSPLEFRAVDMWELFWDKQNSEGYDPTVQSEDFDFYNYYGEQVHKSRVMRLKGLTAPSFIRPRLRGWGFSVVEVLVRSINQYLKATDLGFEVLDEFKLDVYKIKNLVNTLLSPNGQQKIQERVQLANWQKNYQNAVVMDSEDDFDHKQLSFAGLAEAMAGIRMQVASDMRMPLTKLFGISAAGFNSGEDDIEVYNAMVESQVRNKLKYVLLRMCEIKCQKLFGFIPGDLTLAFKPLRVLSAVDEETVKTQKFTRILQAKERGEITSEEFRDACNKGDLFDITLDTVPLDAGGYLSDEASDEGTDPYDDKDVDDPGANRVDTQKALGSERGGISKEPPKPPAPKSADAPKVKAKTSKDAPEPKKKNLLNDDGWDEAKHPRADDGKFGTGGGAASDKGKKPEGSEPKTAKHAAAIKFEKPVSDDKVKEVLNDSKISKTFSNLVSSHPSLHFAVDRWAGAGYIYTRMLQRGEKLEGTELELGESVLKEFARNFDKLPTYEGPLVRDLQLEIGDALSAFKAGEEFTLDAHSSFTARERYSSSRRKVRMIVERNTSGRATWGLSNMPEELEVIVPKGQKYVIDRVEEAEEAPYVRVYIKEV